MYPLVCIFAFLGLALAAPTTNNTTTTAPTIVTNPTSTITQASMLSNTTTTPSSTPCSILIENTPWLLTDITHFTPSLPSQNHTNSTTSSSSYSSSTNSSSSSPSSSIPSGFISFHFHDTNKGLGLETRCFRTFPPRDRHGSSEVDDKPGGGTYFPGEDGRVRFAYTAAAEGAAGEGEGELKVGRVHRDDCLGKPPYNYMVAYGKQTLQLANMTTTTTSSTNTTTDRGVWSWLERLEMKITAVT